MGAIPTSPASFVANTRAKSAEVNAKFSAIYSAVRDGTDDLYINGLRFNRFGNQSVTITGSDCIFLAYFNVGTGNTYDIATSTARLACLGELIVNTNGALHVATNAVAHIF